MDNPGKKMTSYTQVAISISMEGWSFSFWPEAKEQLIHDLFSSDSHSCLTQVTSQKDLVPVLASVPGTVQTPLSVGSYTINREKQVQNLGCLTQVDDYCRQVLCPQAYKAFHLSFLLFFSWKYLVSVEELNSGCKIGISNLHVCCSDPHFWFGIVPTQKKWL